MKEKSNAFLEYEPIGKLMRKFTIPCVISLVVAALYNIVDQIFIANASYLGSYGNAANNVVFPLTVVALSVAVWIGDGCCTFVSICLGANRKEDAHRSIGNSIILCVAISLILMVIYLTFQNAIITMFGGRVNEETFTLSKEYFFFISLGIPFFMFGQMMNPIIRSDGNPKFAMISTILGAVINIILDPIFIFVFKWGMMGAAVATVAGQAFTAALAIWYIFHIKAVSIKKSSFVLSTALMKKFLPLGMTSFLSQISIVASMAAMNNMILIYGAKDAIFGLKEYAQIPMAVIGIVMKFFQIVISVCVGLSAGCIPIVGFNVGAGQNGRVKELFRKLLLSELILGIAALLIVEVFPAQLIAIFGASKESVYYTEFALKVFRIYLCMFPLALINKACFIFTQALGKAKQSALLSFLREVVFGVGFALLLPKIFALDGVLYSMPISDFITFVFTAVLILGILKKLEKGNEYS